MFLRSLAEEHLLPLGHARLAHLASALLNSAPSIPAWLEARWRSYLSHLCAAALIEPLEPQHTAPKSLKNLEDQPQGEHEARGSISSGELNATALLLELLTQISPQEELSEEQRALWRERCAHEVSVSEPALCERQRAWRAHLKRELMPKLTRL